MGRLNCPVAMQANPLSITAGERAIKGSKTKDYHRASPDAVAVLNKVKLFEYIENQLR